MDISLEEILQGTIDLIPLSWQYPEITCARIILEGQEFMTKNFRETIWRQTSDIVVHGEQSGIVEVCYLEERPESDEGPFLKEETSLINAMARRLGKIIERKRMEDELLKKNDELESFVYTVSHDLKNPLISLRGFVNAFIEENKGRLTEDGKFMTERIFANADQMEDMIQDLLELSRIGRITGPAVEINVRDMLKGLSQSYAKSLKDKNIELRITSEEGCVIHADKGQIIKAMDNLMSNAMKFMGDTKDPKIELICRHKGESLVQMGVKDNGIGIDPKYHEKIFEIFKRLGPDDKTEGTGVGLALVKKGIEGLGGRVWVESEVGKGAEFWIELPKKLIGDR
jgi:signal transduction histidine kinase